MRALHDQRPPSTSPRRMEDHVKQNPCNKDRISGLHDDILLHILSRMDTKTAVATSILSRRWRYLYPLLPSFHLIESGSQIFRRNRSRPTWLCIHTKLKNKLLTFLNIFHAFANPQTHPKMTSLVVEFRYLGDECEDLLKECIKVALSGKLKNLEVQNRGHYYVFPSQCLSDGLGDCLRSLAISNCFVTKPDRFSTFRSLQKLTLSGLSFLSGYQEINTGQQRFQILLKSCSSLEILSIEYSTILPLLIVDAPNQLKELTINHCRTDEINISHAPKLNKLECCVTCAHTSSKCCKLYVSAVPCLNYLRLGFHFYPHEKSNYTLEMLARAAPHLETLVLRSVNMVWTAEKCCNVSFLNLRHLVLMEVQTREICSSSWIRLLLESAPFLESLEIDINIKTEYYWDSSEPPSVVPHDNLKVLKLKGFGEVLMELEMSLILFVLESTTRLERVVISSDASHGKQRLMTKKSKILNHLGIGTDSKPLIIFT